MTAYGLCEKFRVSQFTPLGLSRPSLLNWFVPKTTPVAAVAEATR